MKGHTVVLCLLVLIGLGLSASAQAQLVSGVSLRVRAGLERYGLQDIRKWQEQEQGTLRGLGVPAEITDAFPAHPGLRVEVATQLPNGHRLGLSAGYNSTGGRVHYADYSGEVRTDWVVARRSVGLFVEQLANERATWAIPVTLRGSLDLARLRYETLARLGNDVERGETEFSAWSFSVEPEVGVEVKTFGSTFVRATVGFGYTFGGTLELDGEPVGLAGSSSPLKLHWHGWRTGLAVGLDLPGWKRSSAR
jgi:hypothetical protein